MSTETSNLSLLVGLRVVLFVCGDGIPESVVASTSKSLPTLLELIGASVILTRDVYTTVDAVRHNNPDVLFCYLGRSWGPAEAVLKDLRALTRAEGGGVPALALGAHGSESDGPRTALRLGFARYLTMPASSDEINLALLKVALQRQQ